MPVDLLASAAFTLLVILCALISGLALAEIGARHRARAARRQRTAKQRADILLKQWLSPMQRMQYENHGHFEVLGSHSGKRYRIRSERQMNIDELDDYGRRAVVWCFGPERYLPIGDVLLAQKLALENDEQAALAIANRSH